MAFREVRVFEVSEVLRLWLRGEGLRSIERLAGVNHAYSLGPSRRELNLKAAQRLASRKFL